MSGAIKCIVCGTRRFSQHVKCPACHCKVTSWNYDKMAGDLDLSFDGDLGFGDRSYHLRVNLPEVMKERRKHRRGWVANCLEAGWVSLDYRLGEAIVPSYAERSVTAAVDAAKAAVEEIIKHGHVA